MCQDISSNNLFHSLLMVFPFYILTFFFSFRSLWPNLPVDQKLVKTRIGMKIKQLKFISIHHPYIIYIIFWAAAFFIFFFLIGFSLLCFLCHLLAITCSCPPHWARTNTVGHCSMWKLFFYLPNILHSYPFCSIFVVTSNQICVWRNKIFKKKCKCSLFLLSQFKHGFCLDFPWRLT